MAKQRISSVITPFVLIESDPYKHQNRSKYLKVLTKKRKFDTIKKLKRKDNGMSNKKKNKLLMPTGSLALLAIFAVVGLTELLGGQLIDVITSAFVCMALLAFIYDVRI